MRYKRVFLVVLDSVGAGAMPDAGDYGDAGADTLGHIARAVDRLELPHLQKLGLGNLHPMDKVPPAEHPLACYGKLRERSAGKDTMTGHWEMMGLYTTEPFQTFTDTGFPPELIARLEELTGREIIGNKAASGTEILEELGEQEVEQDKLIVYTSADSVLQICGNEETMGLETLYHYCELARELTLQPQWRVGRVIARPYVGKKRGEFKRTSNRRDYALPPPSPTVLDVLQGAGLDVIGVGKIHDIFSGQGLTRWLHSDSSVQGMEQTIALAGGGFHRPVLCEPGGLRRPVGPPQGPPGLRKRAGGLRSEPGPSHGGAGGGGPAAPHRGPRQRPHLYRHRPHPGESPPVGLVPGP